jgi:hypothetical protein
LFLKQECHDGGNNNDRFHWGMFYLTQIYEKVIEDCKLYYHEKQGYTKKEIFLDLFLLFRITLRMVRP